MRALKQLLPLPELSEKRALIRNPSTRLRGFTVFLKVCGETKEVELFDLTSIGLGCVFGENSSIKPGDPVEDIEIWFGNKRAGAYPSGVVRHVSGESGIVGIALSSTQRARFDRQKSRFKALDDLAAQLSFEDPFRVNEIVTWRALDMSVTGAQFSSSLSNRHLLAGLEVQNARLTLPGLGSIEISFRVSWIKTGASRLVFGIAFTKISKSSENLLSQYLLVLAATELRDAETLVSLIEQGSLSKRELGKATRVRPVSSTAERYQVAELRYLAYSTAQKVPEGFKPKDMWDEFDSRSMTYGLFFGSFMVATFRMTPSQNKDDTFPWESLFSVREDGARNRHAECSKLAIHPGFQNSDLMIRLIECITQEANIGFEYLYIVSTRDFMHNYTRLGARPLTRFRPHPVKKDEELALFRLRCSDTALGKSSSGLTWLFALRSVSRFLRKNGFIQERPNYLRIRALMLVEGVVYFFKRKFRIRRRTARSDL